MGYETTVSTRDSLVGVPTVIRGGQLIGRAESSQQSHCSLKSRRENEIINSENPNEPGPSRRRTSDMSNTSLLNQSIDYVALVEQHLKDEQMARDLQRAENSLQPSSNTQVRDSAVQLSSGSDPLRRVSTYL